MRLNPAAFNAWLSGNIGQLMNWRKGNACPCFNPKSGAALPGHPLCGGKGWIWDAPIQTKAGLSQQKVDRAWAMMGQWEPGDGILTIPSDSAMYELCGRFDRIELLNSTDAFKLLLTRGVNDRIFLPVVQFTRVFWLDPLDQNATIDGGLPVIDVSGNLTWPNNDGPPLTTQYSIAGTRYTDYYVWNHLPSDRNEHFGAPLPRKLLMRRFDLFGR
jgi:hypothetical protein